MSDFQITRPYFPAGLLSRLDIRRPRSEIEPCHSLVGPVLEVGRLFHHGSCNLGIGGRSGELQKRSDLTQDVLVTSHVFPQLVTGPRL
jgi:hypothetical protein